MPCARWRPKMSAGPPAGKGTTRVSGLLGNGCLGTAPLASGQRAEAGKRAAAEMVMVSSGWLTGACRA